MNARFSELCTGCSRCVPQCPVRIDIPWLNQNLRQRMNQTQENSAVKSLFGSLTGSSPQDREVPLPKQFFGNYHSVGKWGTEFASLANASTRLPMARDVMESIFGVDHRRELPAFPAKTWEQLFHEEPQSGVKAATIEPGVVMLADTFTNYGSPQRGMAAVRVLRAIGVNVVLSPSIPDGRAAMSQGMIDTARVQARAMAIMLKPYLDAGKKIVVLEPSVLAMLRFDFKHLLDDESVIATLAANSFEPLQAVWDIASETGLDIAKLFPAAKSRFGTRLFYHAHC